MTVPDGKGTSQRDLAARWRAELGVLRKRGAKELAEGLESYVDELEQVLVEADLEALTLDQAAAESGYTKGHLGRLIAADRLDNVGRKHAPRVRRGDLPKKPEEPLGEGPDLVGRIHEDVA